jgi:hypothetical protein
VSAGNLQINADQGLYTAIEWAAQFGIDAQAALIPGPGQVPNTLGLQQQTQNYWGAADYSTKVWNFNFAGGYLERSHVRAQVLLSTGWTALAIDTEEYVAQFRYELREDGALELREDGTIETDEGFIDPNDANNSPFRFIGPFQLYMDFSSLGEVPQALLIYRHTPRNIKVSSLADDTRITADGMDPSARHALFVAVELGEQLSQYAPPCDCFITELQTLSWSLPTDDVHTSMESVTLDGSPYVIYNIDMFITGDMEARHYADPSVRVVGGLGPDGYDQRFVSADNANTDGSWSSYNIYKVEISDPPQTYYVNQATSHEDVFHSHIFPLYDGSSNYRLPVQARGNATITFSADDINGIGAYYPQFGTITVRVTGSNG